MNIRECCPPKGKQPDGNKERPKDGRREPKFGLAATLHSCPFLEAPDEARANAVEYRVRSPSHERTNEYAQKAKTDLPEIEAVDFAKDEGEGAEEEVKNAEEDGCEQAQAENHELEDQELKGSEERDPNGLDNGLVGPFDGSLPAVVAGFLSPRPGHVPENDGVCGGP